jgi:hypothetical protein
MHYFSCSGAPGADRINNTGTHYVKLVFFNTVGSVGHVVCPGRETSTHYFSCWVGPVQIPQKLRQNTLHRTCIFACCAICWSHGAFRWVQGVNHRWTIFHTRVRLERIPQKACRDTLRWTCVFASGGICGSCSVFCCVQGKKHQCIFFMLGCAQCESHKQRIGAHYTKLVFF